MSHRFVNQKARCSKFKVFIFIVEQHLHNTATRSNFKLQEENKQNGGSILGHRTEFLS